MNSKNFPPKEPRLETYKKKTKEEKKEEAIALTRKCNSMEWDNATKNLFKKVTKTPNKKLSTSTKFLFYSFLFFQFCPEQFSESEASDVNSGDESCLTEISEETIQQVETHVVKDEKTISWMMNTMESAKELLNEEGVTFSSLNLGFLLSVTKRLISINNAQSNNAKNKKTYRITRVLSF